MLRFIAGVIVVCIAVVFLQNGGSAESRAHAAGSWIHNVAVSTVAATRSFVTGVTQGAPAKTARTEAPQVTASVKTPPKVETATPFDAATAWHPTTGKQLDMDAGKFLPLPPGASTVVADAN